MKLDDLLAMWSKECKIDDTDLANESLKTPMLHAKYYEIYTKENLLAQKAHHDYKKLFKLKTQYYGGKLSEEELTQLGWEQFELKVHREDMDKYIDADDDIITSLLKISLQKEKVDALKEIIKCIHNRNFIIKAAIDFLKFSNGF